MTHWAESKQSYSPPAWTTSKSYSVGDEVKYDEDGLNYSVHTAHTSSNTNKPTNASYYGKLIELDKYVAWKQTGENEIGDVIEVWGGDPRVNAKSEIQKFTQSENGVQVVNGPNIVYIEYRQKVPSLFYTAWAASSTDYEVDDVVRFEATGADFDLYRATTKHTPTSSNDPKDSNAPWALIEIPRDFRAFLTHGAAADLLMNDEKEHMASIQQALSDKALAELLDKLERQEKQSKQMTVMH